MFLKFPVFAIHQWSLFLNALSLFRSRWNWDDGDTEAEVDLNALLQKAKNTIGN